jgi:hypothetical protein
MVSPATNKPLSMPDKMMRLALFTYPQPLDISQFYPALSLYRVHHPFSLADFRSAAEYYLKENPFFSRFHLVERKFDKVDDFPLTAFQEVIADEYENFFDGFLLLSVTFANEPNIQGIFTAFPVSMQDGYRCFLFHQALMRSLKTQQDEFRVAETLALLGVRTNDLVSYLPERKATSGSNDADRTLPFVIGEAVEPASKVGPYLDEMKEHFLARSCENMITLKNGLYYASDLPLGNFLIFLRISQEAVMRSSGVQLHRYYNARQDESVKIIDSWDSVEEIERAGTERIADMLELPHRFFVNNYGDASSHDGSDLAAHQGTLVRYQWHMPNVILNLMAGERAGAAWTITIRGRAFKFLSS